MDKKDVIVIGGGPGGYPAAIRAAQNGKTVLLVDKGTLGGECLNWGCIPSKALISASDYYNKLSTGKLEELGISVDNVRIDIKKMQAWKESVQKKLISGIAQLLKGNSVEYIEGTASFLDKNKIKIIKSDGEEIEAEADNFVIAIGTKFISLGAFPIDNKKILSAKGALALDHVPESLVVIGGGVIGMELGTVWAKLGSKVSIVEMMPEIIPTVDPGLVRIVKMKLKKMGVNIYTQAKASKVEHLDDNTMELEVETKKGTEKIKCNKILSSIGKRADPSELNLEAAGVKTDDRGFILVDKKCTTNIDNIYAIGDCADPGKPLLAHRATKQGLIAADAIAGCHPCEQDYKTIPSAIFTDPEIGTAGMSEKEAKEAGYSVIIGRIGFGANGRALTHLAGEGYIKIIADEKTKAVLGVEIVGPSASDIISEAALAIEMGATVEDIAETIHPHPTIGEMTMEAAEAALGKAIHVLQRK